MMVYIDNMKLKSYIVTFICFSIDETVFLIITTNKGDIMTFQGYII